MELAVAAPLDVRNPAASDSGAGVLYELHIEVEAKARVRDLDYQVGVLAGGIGLPVAVLAQYRHGQVRVELRAVFRIKGPRTLMIASAATLDASVMLRVLAQL